MGVKHATFRTITCEGLFIKDGYKNRGAFGLDADGDARENCGNQHTEAILKSS